MQCLFSHLKRWLGLPLLITLGLLAATANPASAVSAAHAIPASESSAATPAYSGWLDRQGTATVATVPQLAYREPFTGWKGWGFGLEPVWLKIHVPASAENAPPQILIARPPFLDNLVFYDSATGAVRQAGDFFPATDDALGSVLFTFEVPAQTVGRDVFIKFESTSTRLAHLSLIPLAEARALTRWVEWATGSILLLSLVIMIWALAQCWLTRDRVMYFFAFKQFVITGWGFLFLGFARVTVGSWFSEGVLSFISSTAVALVVSSTLWFFAALLKEYNARPRMLGLLRLLGWVVLSLILLKFAGLTHISLKIINTAAPLILLLILATLWTADTAGIKKAVSKKSINNARNPAEAPQSAPPIAKSVLFGYLCVYAVINAVPAMTHVGLIPETPILFLGNMPLLVIDGLIMLTILTVRQHRFNEQHQITSTQLVLQQEQARLDQRHLSEQRQLLAMLAHEMKTPLANLRIWMEAGERGRPVMKRAISDMNLVIERSVHAGQLAEQSLKPHNEWIDAIELTQTVLDVSRQPERVNLQMPDQICAIHTDVQMLSIVLSNVLENAYKYSPPDSRIDLQLHARAGPDGAAGWQWCIENAAGVAGLPDAAQVFDKYYRSPQAKRQSGSGLGLFLVKSLLDLMDGHVSYISIDQRARFEVWLPAAAPDKSE